MSVLACVGLQVSIIGIMTAIKRPQLSYDGNNYRSCGGKSLWSCAAFLLKKQRINIETSIVRDL